MMKRGDAEEFTQSLGQIVAGSWRQIALAKRLGVPQALGLSVESWVNDHLGGYVKLSIADRREAVAELTADGMSQRDIGEVVGIKKSQVNRDLHNVPNGTPEDDEPARIGDDDVPNGTTPINAVAALAADEKVREAAKSAERREGKAHRRAEREVDLASKQRALPTRKYGVIVADPEWRFEPWSRTTGMDRAADNHYPTSCTEVIAARDVPSIAADDSVLFLWATVPMLPHALTVMAAWGFDYRSHFVWAKDRIGTGYWNRNKHEILLIGVRGNVPAPAMGTQAHSLIAAPVSEHSAKPECFLEMVETYFPTLPKIELNRRGSPRRGWDAWGNETALEAAE